jgi:hypothetical protein
MPFDKPLIVVATTRYELGRHDAQDWSGRIHRISSKPYNTIAANSLYDLEYLEVLY